MSAKPSIIRVDDDDLYFGEDDAQPLNGLSFEKIAKDCICTQCGLWKSEHNYDVCMQPNWQ